MTNIDILKSCFYSRSDLWTNYLASNTEVNILYYPSAGPDMRPLVFTKQENLEFMGLRDTANYFEPDLFIFSDYFPFTDSKFLDSRYVHWDNYTLVYLEEYCEIMPTEAYAYRFNEDYVSFPSSPATGKAIFFRAKVTSHKLSQPFFKHGIYFFYENVNLLEQLFLKHQMSFSHLVWKRDGSGLGGGRVKLDFIFDVCHQCNTSIFFLWDFYLNAETSIQSNTSYDKNRLPKELMPYMHEDFQITLNKALTMRWDISDRMNLYFRS
jgi:hypothetical protein